MSLSQWHKVGKITQASIITRANTIPRPDIITWTKNITRANAIKWANTMILANTITLANTTALLHRGDNGEWAENIDSISLKKRKRKLCSKGPCDGQYHTD